jgi:RimJ/RimL family protein N-acetyltransferase
MNLAALDRPIETARFTLRLIGEVDLDGLFAVHGDDEVTRFIPSASWRERADALAWLVRNMTMHDEDKLRRWAIVERGGEPGSERVIGDCMLFNFDAASSRAEIGFVLGRRDWGRGAVYEAVGALISTAFEALELRRIEACADVGNSGSDRALTKLGFVREGTLRQRATFKGEVRDSNVYGLLRHEWRRA